MEIIKKSVDLAVSEYEFNLIVELADYGLLNFEKIAEPTKFSHFISVSPETYDYLLLVFNYTKL